MNCFLIGGAGPLLRRGLLAGIGLLIGLGALGGEAARAQTGPGGVGNADGNDGQPANVLWLRASDVPVTNGAPVGTWPDLSGNAHDFGQSATDRRPTYRDGADGINQKGVLDFGGDDAPDGTPDLLTDGDGLDYLVGEDALTAIYVVKSDQTNYDGGVFTTHAPNNTDTNAHTFRFDTNGTTSGNDDQVKWAVTTDKGAPNSDEAESSVNVSTGSGPLALHTTQPRLFMTRWSSGEPLDLYVNGYEEPDITRAGKGTQPPTGGLDEDPGEVVRIGQGGKAGDPSAFWNGDVAEVILFSEKLNTTQRRIVESYLQTRYAFGNFNDDLYGFDGSHPNGVAGIGRTSSSDAHREAASSILTLEAAGALDDGDFILFGNDASPLALTTSERPDDPSQPADGSNARKLRREWKVDLTGASSRTIDVNVDLSALSLPGGYNDYALFVDDDGDFTSGATFYDLDANGRASGVTLEDADYVTVAAIKRTVSFNVSTRSVFEDAGGPGLGDSFFPEILVELNYSSSEGLSVPFSVTEATGGTLFENSGGTWSAPDDYGVRGTTVTIPDGETRWPINQDFTVENLEVFNDGKAAGTDPEESSPEDLEITLTSAAFPAELAGGGATTQTLRILDDDDLRKVSYSGYSGGAKPIRILNSNPEEDPSDTSTPSDRQSQEENGVTSVDFEVALPSGITGSPATFVVFEVSGADPDDFSIPDNATQTPLGPRRGEAVINTTKQSGGQDTGYGTFTIQINDDALFESDETLTVSLTGGQSATLDPAGNLDLTYEILNDDARPTVEFVSGSGSDTEDVTDASGTLRLSGPAGRALDVAFDVSGSATGGGTDYTQNTASPVTIAAGDTRETIDFSVRDDGLQEKSETIEVSIDYAGSDAETPSGGGANTTFSYTIVDDDNVGPSGPGGVGDVNSLALWLRADAGTNASPGGGPASDGAQVGQWVDQSGNGHDFTRSGSGRPSLQANAINGRPALAFTPSDSEFLVDADGSDQYINGEPGFSLFTVSETDDTGSEAGVFVADSGPDRGSGSDQNDAVSLRQDPDNGGSDERFEVGVSTTEGGGTDRTFNSNNGTLSTDPQLLQLDWSSGSDFTFYLNGTSEGSVAAPAGQLRGAETVAVGRSDTNGDPYWNGRIAESIFYTQTLNRAQRRIVNNYLAAKYDIEPATDIYAGDTGDGDPSTGGDYDLGMIGVGQAGDGSFHARARGAGLDLRVKNGLDDGDYLTAGHRISDNSVTDELSGFAPDNNDRRSLRVWAVDRTDAGGDITVDVTFDLSTLGFRGLPGAADNYTLIRSSQDSTGGQNYDWSSVATAGNVSGTRITFTDVPLQDGQYYTLATTDRDRSPLTNRTALTIRGTDGNEGRANAAPSTYGGDAGWRLLGVPVQNATAGDIFSGTDDPVAEFNLASDTKMFYTWDDDEQGGSWVESSPGTAVPNGEGFIFFVFDDEGTPDADPVDPTLVLDVPDARSVPGDTKVIADDQGDGFSTASKFILLSNPYTVPYDLTSVLDGTPDVQNAVQVWDGGRANGGTYRTAVVDGTTGETEGIPTGDVVAPWQGFFVERSTTGVGPTTFTFETAGRTTGAGSILGSKRRSTGTQHGAPTQVKFRLVTRNARDSLITRDRAAALYFHPAADAAWDPYDASKFFPLTAPGDPYATVALVGEGADGDKKPKAVESRSAGARNFTVPLEVRASSSLSGTMTLSAPVWRNVPEGMTLELIDTKGTSTSQDDEVHELAPGGDGYSFSREAASSRGSTSKRARTGGASDDPRSPALRKGGLAMGRPQTMELAEKARRKSRDTVATRFRLRVTGRALPVEFAEVSATGDRQDVVLDWSTASETNNSGFYVEHRGPDSTEAFSRVGFVEGQGTTDRAQTYSYRVEDLTVGRHAFRLRQVDNTGATTYSKTVTARVRLQAPYSISEPSPNPFRESTALDLTVKETQDVTVAVYDVLGRKVTVLHRGPIKANDPLRVRLGARDLSSGLYLIRVRGEGFSTVRRATLVR